MGARAEGHRDLVGSVDADCLDQLYGAYLWDVVLVEARRYGQGKERAEKSKGGGRTITITRAVILGLHSVLALRHCKT